MTEPTNLDAKEPRLRPRHRMPEGSTFYERIVPILLVSFAVVMVGLILFAMGVLLGFVPFV